MNSMFSPQRIGKQITGSQWLTLLNLAAAVAMLAALYAVFVYAPTERVMGQVQRIFYFHIPSAWVGFLAFFVAFLGGMGYLLRRRRTLDILMIASLEIGVLFSTMVLLSGSLWARPIWNTWWTWDPRLTATLVMWVFYVGVLLLRSFVNEEDMKARYTAVLSIIGFVNVPIVFMAIRWWRTIHPVLFGSQGMSLEPPMVWALLIALLAFTLLYACILLYRMRLECLEDEVDMLRRALEARELP